MNSAAFGAGESPALVKGSSGSGGGQFGGGVSGGPGVVGELAIQFACVVVLFLS